MKTTYKKELKAKEYLDSHGIENFIPMQKKILVKSGRKKVVEQPAIHNLIFVKTALAELKNLKEHLNYLHNCLVADGDTLQPVIVPTSAMEQFIDAMTNHPDQVTYIDATSVRLEKGTPVRITDGQFKGYEGELQKIKGKRDRRVHVNIKGIAAYMFEVDARFIETI